MVSDWQPIHTSILEQYCLLYPRIRTLLEDFFLSREGSISRADQDSLLWELISAANRHEIDPTHVPELLEAFCEITGLRNPWDTEEEDVRQLSFPFHDLYTRRDTIA